MFLITLCVFEKGNLKMLEVKCVACNVWLIISPFLSAKCAVYVHVI